MKPLIEFEESALDSPVYRLQVQQTEQSLWQLESSVKQLLKSTKNGVEAAEEYSQKNTLFAQELEQLSREEADEEVISGTLQRFAGCIKEIEKSRQIMLQQLQSVFMEPLDLLIKRDIANIKVKQ